jgi:hypothetical protein
MVNHLIKEKEKERERMVNHPTQFGSSENEE